MSLPLLLSIYPAVLLPMLKRLHSIIQTFLWYLHHTWVFSLEREYVEPPPIKIND